MRGFATPLTALAFVLSPSLAAAQANLGELLDAGGKRVTAEGFRKDIVQHTVEGPTPAGGAIEIYYAANGSIQGQGTAPQWMVATQPVRGEWTIDDVERVCAAMQLGPPGGGSSAVLPPRCQAWFKLGDAYFISDSDSDRRAKVVRRTIKPSSIVLAPDNLGGLLDAGAKRVSAEEFRRDVVKRTLVGRASQGGKTEILYAANGSLHGQETQPLRSISGKWTIDESARICTTGVRIGPSDLPNRCEYWFKLGETYYVSESDTDRQAYVFPRTPNP